MLQKCLQIVRLSSSKGYGPTSGPLLRVVTDSKFLPQVFKQNISSLSEPSAAKLWASVTGVSNAGKNRGRAKAIRAPKSKNLNYGQIIGEGKVRMLFPGLSGPVMKDKKVVNQQPLPPDPEYEEKILKARDAMGKFKGVKLSPLERGWSGIKLPGRKLGAPYSEIEGTAPTWPHFDSVCVESTQVSNMTGRFGRVRQFRVTMIVGNKQGLIGYAHCSSPAVWSAVARAKKRAGQRLMRIRRDGSTIFHDVTATYGSTTVVLQPRPRGFGIHAQRTVKAVCEQIGITDVYAKCLGKIHQIHLVRAVLLALLQQKTHQEMADEKNLIVTKSEPGKPTVVVARPTNGYVRKESELSHVEQLDYMQYVTKGLLFVRKEKRPKFYTFLPKYQHYLRKQEHCLTHPLQRQRLALEYGYENTDWGVKVFGPLTSKYREAKFIYIPPEKVEDIE